MSTDEYRRLEALPVHDPTTRAPGEDRIVLSGGTLTHPRTVLPSDLALLPWVTLDEDFRCIHGWYVPDLHWHGVRLLDALEAYDIAPAGHRIEVCAGDYSTTLDPEQADRALLALWLGELPLAGEHGGPVRLVVSDNICSSSVKWVDRITVLDH